MQITNTSAALRPRSVWQAMDLGFVLTQASWWQLYRLWLGVALPVFVICTLVSYDNPVIATTLFWWLKPAYEQLPLIYLSRTLFKQDPAIKIYSLASLKFILKQLFLNLTFRRLSWIRSFTAPVAQLEGLSGNARSRRLESLTRSASGFEAFTLIMLNFEIIFAASLALTIVFMKPETLDFTVWYEGHEVLFDHIGNALYFLSAGIIAPFFVAGGFAMYINRRTILEGWDIEIEFKRLQERMRKTSKNSVAAGWLALILLPALFFSLGYSTHAAAKKFEAEPESESVAPIISKEEAKKTISEIMADKDFGEKTKSKVWRLKDKDVDFGDLSFSGNLGSIIAEFGEIMLWVIIGIAIFLLLYYLPGWLKQIPTSHIVKPEKNKPNVLFGLNIEKNSLPDDVAGTALALMKSGEFRQCLSLLYRASLSLLIHQHGLDVHESHTEGECLALVESLGQSRISQYFSQLTLTWIALAYGHSSPTEATLESLCRSWVDTFAAEKQ